MPIHPGVKFAGKSQNGSYGDWVEEVDWSVGQVLDVLRESGLEKNTLVIFSSDNGPWLARGNAAGEAGPLHGGKGSTWDGGVSEAGLRLYSLDNDIGEKTNVADVNPEVVKKLQALAVKMGVRTLRRFVQWSRRAPAGHRREPGVPFPGQGCGGEGRGQEEGEMSGAHFRLARTFLLL